VSLDAGGSIPSFTAATVSQGDAPDLLVGDLRRFLTTLRGTDGGW